MTENTKNGSSETEDEIIAQLSRISLGGSSKKDPEDDIEVLKTNLAQYHNATSKTAVVYDIDMGLHKNIFSRMHPERPDRILRPMQLLVESRLMSRLRTVASREVTRDEALTVHTAEHWAFLELLPGMSNRDLWKQGEELDSIYLCSKSFRSAKLAAGSLLAITEEVLTDRAVNGVAVIRPPGHHCKAERPMGFCLLGNVPIACRFAIDKYGVERILVVDWDVHHGNGTQDMFIDDDRIFYMSMHRYDYGSFYPCTGDPRIVGSRDGTGYNLNIGWNQPRKGDGDYLQAFYDLILPLAWSYQPQLVFISAGFDSGLGDPLGNCCVTSECYGIMTHHLMSVCKGKVILALEGGYNLTTVSEGIKACTSVMLGDHPDSIDPENCAPSPGGMESIQIAGENIAPYWNNLVRFRKPPSPDIKKERRPNLRARPAIKAPPPKPINDDSYKHETPLKSHITAIANTSLKSQITENAKTDPVLNALISENSETSPKSHMTEKKSQSPAPEYEGTKCDPPDSLIKYPDSSQPDQVGDIPNITSTEIEDMELDLATNACSISPACFSPPTPRRSPRLSASPRKSPKQVFSLARSPKRSPILHLKFISTNKKLKSPKMDRASGARCRLSSESSEDLFKTPLNSEEEN